MPNYSKEKTIIEPEFCRFVSNSSRQRIYKVSRITTQKNKNIYAKHGVTSIIPALRRQGRKITVAQATNSFRSQGYTRKPGLKTKQAKKNTKNTFIFTLRNLKLHTTSRTTIPSSGTQIHSPLHCLNTSNSVSTNFPCTFPVSLGAATMTWDYPVNLLRQWFLYQCLVIKLFIFRVFSPKFLSFQR